MDAETTDAGAPPTKVEPLYEPGRRGAWVAPLLLAGAGSCAVQNIVFRTLIIPLNVAQDGADAVAGLRTTSDVIAVCGGLLAIVGVVMGMRGMRRVEPTFSTAWTLAQFALSLMALFSVPTFMFIARRAADEGRTESGPVFTYLITLIGFSGATFAVLGTLRWRRARIAAVLTPALALLMLIGVPMGTALALLWYYVVRKRETSAL
jgi:hypothetical protein